MPYEFFKETDKVAEILTDKNKQKIVNLAYDTVHKIKLIDRELENKRLDSETQLILIDKKKYLLEELEKEGVKCDIPI